VADAVRSALIVASDTYDDPGLRRLRAPAADAQALSAVLVDPRIGGFDTDTLLNEPCHVINRAIDDFFADRRPDDLLLLHISCHGIKDEAGELHFATRNTSLARLASTSVAADFVSRRMTRSRSRRIVLLLDCCYAGAFERGMTSRAGAAVGVEEQFSGRGRAVITASSAMEYAFEGEELADSTDVTPSVFTSALVQGLATGEADQDQDGRVALDELYDYGYGRVRELTPNQTPSKWAFGLQGELYIARRARPVTRPTPLPTELRQVLDHPLAGVRSGAVEELSRLLHGPHAGLALAARLALERLCDDDSRTVSASASEALASLRAEPGKTPALTEQTVRQQDTIDDEGDEQLPVDDSAISARPPPEPPPADIRRVAAPGANTTTDAAAQRTPETPPDTTSDATSETTDRAPPLVPEPAGAAPTQDPETPNERPLWLRSPALLSAGIGAMVLTIALAALTTGENEPGATDGAGVAQGAVTIEGGTLLFGDEREPEVLNGFLINGDSQATAKVFNNVFPGAYVIEPDFSLQPWLLEGEAEITESPFTVTYTIRGEAEWSDGTPITADDFIFTYEIHDAGAPHAEQISSRVGYELITDFETDGDKTVTFNFEEPYAAWRLLFSSVLPAHALGDEDFLTTMNDELPDVSGGPFMFDSWERGTQLRLVRNDNYWDGDVALDEIIMHYVPDTTTLTQQLLGGELDMYDPQPQIELIDQLEGASDRINYEVGLGPAWEHISFNTLVSGLDKDYVRQAIALGINRERIVEALLQPVAPEAEVLQQPFWMTNSKFYQPTFDQWDHHPDAAISLLEENGCERDDGDIFECEGDRLSFRFGTTGGNERRELIQQLVQSDLAQVGIAINIDNDESAKFFERLNTPESCGGICDYDLALFAWFGSPDPSSNATIPNADIYGCDEGDTPRPYNFTAFCNEQLTLLMDKANQTVDLDENAQLWNEAAAVIAEEVPIIPLFQQPQMLAWKNTITGPQFNPTAQTQFWNSADWSYLE
jgi:ABC-type transport system substrate-binding protein